MPFRTTRRQSIKLTFLRIELLTSRRPTVHLRSLNVSFVCPAIIYIRFFFLYIFSHYVGFRIFFTLILIFYLTVFNNNNKINKESPPRPRKLWPSRFPQKLASSPSQVMERSYESIAQNLVLWEGPSVVISNSMEEILILR